MTLTELRIRLRRDLHDEDPAQYRWSDATLDRHVQHALREVSLAVPLEGVATLTTTAGSRDLSLAGLADLVSVEAAEYPVNRYPPCFVPFSLWEATLTLLVDAPPQGVEDVKVYYGRLHTLDDQGSTLPAYLEELVLAGAAGYAALEWANFAANRVNVGGVEVWRRYLAWGEVRLAQFHRGLARVGRRSALRVRRLYASARPAPSRPGLGG